MLYEMKLNLEAFEKMKAGIKKVEIRLFDEKRRKLKIGDEIKFSKLPGRKESIIVKIKNLEKFSSFKEMFEAIDKKLFGHGGLSMEQQLGRIYKIYTKEEEKKLGVLAIFFELS